MSARRDICRRSMMCELGSYGVRGKYETENSARDQRDKRRVVGVLRQPDQREHPRIACGTPLAKVPGLEKTSLTVGAVPVADEAGLYIAQDQGLFAQEGLHVTIKPILSSADATKGQNNGKFDITAGNSVSYMQDQVTHQSDLEIVAEGSQMQPGNQALYTLPGSRITNISQLKGRRIGVNAAEQHRHAAHQLRAQGVRHLGPPGAFRAGEFPLHGAIPEAADIDVAWLPEPFGSEDAESMGLQELCRPRPGRDRGLPGRVVRRDQGLGEEVPADAPAFLDALQAGQQIADSHRNIVEEAMERLPAPSRSRPRSRR